MRILQISSARAIGGGERHLIDLSNEFARRGHHVFVALANNSPIAPQLTEIPPEQIFNLRLRNAFDFPSASKLASIIAENKIEIVHAHLARDYPLARLALRGNKMAHLVLTRHVLFPMSRFHKLAASGVSGVIAVSGAVAKSLRKQGLFPANKIRVIQNGLNFERIDQALTGFDRTKVLQGLGLPDTKRFVATVGELNPLKGQEEFLRAAAIVAATDGNIHFLIVGEERHSKSAKTSQKSVLMDIAATLGISERVHFLNWVSDLAKLLRSIDVFVSASHTESFGLAILEAMACDRPVVATRTEGAEEILQNGETGILVNIGDCPAMADAILRLLGDETMAKDFGRKASKIARSNFSLDRMVTETGHFYSQILA